MLSLHRLWLLRELEARHTVRATAQALGYTASAVSQQLLILEREIGTPLLERVGRRVQLTEAGRVLVRHTHLLLESAEAAEAEIAQVATGRIAGVVRISAFPSAFLRIVSPAVLAIAEAHPYVRVEVEDKEIEQATPFFRRQLLDVVIGDEYDNQPRPARNEFSRTPLLREQVRLLLPTDHPCAQQDRVRLSDLANAVWATSPVGTEHLAMHIRVCRQYGGFDPDLHYASNDFLILLELVRTNGACALLPDLVLNQAPPGVAIRDLDDGHIFRSVYLLTRANRTPAVRVVTEALQAQAAKLAQTTPPEPG
jgi:DNA-binding transcriptional LysR family regulator